MLFSIAFIITFVLGGFTGMLLAMPPVDFVVHNTVFLVAHFHNVLIPGTLYGMIAGYQYWFPKAFGFRLNERWGTISFFCWLFGFYLAFMPLYALGLGGMARRTQEISEPDFQPLLLVAEFGALLLLSGLVTLFVQLYVSVRDRASAKVFVGDPWGARSLEWSISAPPPEYNFAVIPHVSDRDAWHWRKDNGGAYKPAHHYRDIAMPKNSFVGPLIGFFSFACSFGLVWHIWWMAAGGLFMVWMSIIGRSFVRHTKKVIPASEVEAADLRWIAIAQAETVHPRELETTPANAGLAELHA